ncbi:M48 family metallopeptidase [Planctomycetota bacterium]
MAKSRTVEIKGIGPALLEQSLRAKRLNISVKPPGRIRVAVPKGISFREARKFLYAKLDWVKYQIDKIKILELQREAAPKAPPVNKSKARVYLVNRLNVLAGKYGYNYHKVFIRRQRTRWGSCSVKNNINLNMNLVRLPEELIDYVILHELVHIKHKNHSKKFWQEMDKLVGEGKKMQRKLRKYRIV